MQTEKFKQGWFKPQGELPPGEKLASKMLAVRVTERVDAAIRALPEMSAWLRRVIIEAAKRELMQETASENAKPPAAPGSRPLGESQAELVGMIDDLLAIPRLPKPAKEKLLVMRERLTQGLTPSNKNGEHFRGT